MPNVAPYPYVRHRPEHTLLYEVIDHHLTEFSGHLRSQDNPPPAFVLREFHEYLRCGRLEHGFVRVKCTDCKNELLVAFSCKRRGFCPSCGARRMTDTAAHLVDHVLPSIPIRQWVLSFPWPLRLLYAARPQALSRTLQIVLRAIDTHLVRKAGLRKNQHARSGAVTFIQRFGSALNLNVHLHMLIPDGVYVLQHGKPRFHRTAAPAIEEMQHLMDRIIQRITRQLLRDCLLIEDADQPYLDLTLDGGLDQLSAASVQYRIATGPHAGRKTLTLRQPGMESTAPSPKPFTVARDGFSLNAAVSCQPHERHKLERLCRYVARPPLAIDRLSVADDGKLCYALKHPYSTGITHFLFEPLDLLARLAALVPRPRTNLTRYHGVFAPNSRFRRQIVPRRAARSTSRTDQKTLQVDSPPPARLHGLTWAERLRRSFEIDISTCVLCGGRLRVIADITQPQLIDKILQHIKTSRAPPARAATHHNPSSSRRSDAS